MPITAQLGHYRRTLWGWLAALGAGLLLSLVLLPFCAGGCDPLRQVAREVAEVQAGAATTDQPRLSGQIRLLTDNLNHLLVRERAQQQRYPRCAGEIWRTIQRRRWHC